ncbi:MAG: 2-octaprenyl-6-methoxyphenol hydroxylase [Glaciecola sp. HTCC2999]|nr:MAG: 2-octaprenyl-6-methoxyphenol hydroxylase [Glaciecola sp. HTCC2999]
MLNVKANDHDIHTTDILVIGGGVVGLALCQGLLHANLDVRVTLVSSCNILQANAYADDMRAIALAHSTRQHLASMGIPLPDSHATIEQIHISDRGHLGQVRLTAKEQGVSALGYVTQLSALETTLSQQLSQHTDTQFTLFENAQCTQVNTTQQDVTATLDTGLIIHAKTLVFADGQGSDLKRTLGIASHSVDYQQHALVSVVGVSRIGPTRYHHKLTAFERFTDKGPLALLPMSRDAVSDDACQQYYSLVWCASKEDIATLTALDDTSFKHALQTAFGDRAGLFSYISQRQHFPLKLVSHFNNPQRIFSLGNAAQTLHPIAGQGFNLGIRDVMGFIKSVNELPQKEDLGTQTHQDRFIAMRHSDRTAVTQVTSLLVTVFSNAFPGLVIPRNKALHLLHSVPLIKKWFTKIAMGYR